ncbi:hypothetical protein K438DRAFT_1965726 [Mycena galopus ATCC 62051]|nr:hypothetical protein K438DRAFT_1965726 [Mycena galopus ATCC 62051]
MPRIFVVANLTHPAQSFITHAYPRLQRRRDGFADTSRTSVCYPRSPPHTNLRARPACSVHAPHTPRLRRPDTACTPWWRSHHPHHALPTMHADVRAGSAGTAVAQPRRLRTIDYSANTRTPAAVCTPRSSVTYAHPPRLCTPRRRLPAVRPPRPHVHRLHTPRPHVHRHRLRTPRSSVYYAHPLLYAHPVRTHMSIAITARARLVRRLCTTHLSIHYTHPAGPLTTHTRHAHPPTALHARGCARRTHGRHPATAQCLPSKFGAATAAHVRRLRTPTAMHLQKTTRSSAAFLRHEAEVVSAPLVRSLRTPAAVRMPAAHLSTARPTRLSTTHTLPPTHAQFGVLDSERRDIAPTC